MISAIGYNQSSVFPDFSHRAEQRPSINEMELAARGDIVSIHRPEQMTDVEIEQTMQSIEDNLGENPNDAMAAYGNLDYSRVMALLSDPI